MADINKQWIERIRQLAIALAIAVLVPFVIRNGLRLVPKDLIYPNAAIVQMVLALVVIVIGIFWKVPAVGGGLMLGGVASLAFQWHPSVSLPKILLIDAAILLLIVAGHYLSRTTVARFFLNAQHIAIFLGLGLLMPYSIHEALKLTTIQNVYAVPLLATVLGFLLMGIGFIYPVVSVGAGFILGGAGTLAYGQGLLWEHMPHWYPFVVLTLAAGVLIALGSWYLKE